MGSFEMIASICHHEKLAKHGKDRKGNQRWKCSRCGLTLVSESHKRPLGDMRLDMTKAVQILKMLLEGMSIRACERITGVKDDTICDLVLLVGENCDRLLESTVVGVQAKAVELDEIWSFVGCKQKHANLKNYGEGMGDAWSWFAIDADTKMILSHKTGKRDQTACDAFLRRLNGATVGRIQVTSDGFSAYTHAVPMHLGSRCDFAQLIKQYKSTQSEARYSPAEITGIEIAIRFGNPDESRISTSFAERFNLTHRMTNRRLTRLTNAHSKSFEHHSAMVSLFTAFYNFCRKHQSLDKKTPVMAAGLAGHAWSIEELLAAAA